MNELAGSYTAGRAVSDRIPCCVPFCRRTASREQFPHSEEIICGKHWRMIPVEIRSVRARLKRRGRKVEHLLMRRDNKRVAAETQANRIFDQIDRLWARNWENCKKAAIEAAGGIS